ncbi:hypothetical protein INT47_012143 [Mucor saturninus]|uniref:DDE Tnp4 domain-containing protein n=1 Tax=Mucor saturninus TaxID=64648 RepID=A0A8H7QK19_9FUNG|nr:hypothetical protein INT47_012143 [Mucor saturninus]
MNSIDETFFDMMLDQFRMDDGADIFEDEDQYFNVVMEEIIRIDEEFDLEEEMLEQEVALAEERVVADYARLQENYDIFSLFERWVRETILHATTLNNYDIRMDTYETHWAIKHPNLNDNRNSRHSYRAHYRVNKSTFEWLVNRLKVQVTCVLWRFANTHFGYRIAETHLGVTAGLFNNFTNRFIDAMLEITPEIITWPIEDGERALNNARAIDSKLVVIQKPAINGNAYVDGKSHASMNLMAICDAHTRFMYVKTGHSAAYPLLLYYGRNHDARVFTSSVIYHKILFDAARWCPANTCILGDSSYPLLPNFIAPFHGRRESTAEEKIYNATFSSSRIKIEHAFGGLTSRWKFLWKHLYMLSVYRMAKTIVSFCGLHNVCVNQNDIEETILHGSLDFEGFVEADRRNQFENEVNFEPPLPFHGTDATIDAAGMRRIKAMSILRRNNIMRGTDRLT